MAWPEGYGRRVLASVDSTLSEAARIAPELRGPEWILALAQTAGRGRRGRAWAMPPGNFAATLVLPVTGAPSRFALRSFVTALALAEALEAAGVPSAALSLKWPNDVLLHGGKVAGILLESGGRADVLSIGIGVNLIAAPGVDEVETDALAPVSVLGAAAVHIAPDAFLDLLAAAYARHEEIFVTYGFEPIRRLWLARAARLGAIITARTVRETYQGTFRDVDEDGQLVLETSKGRVTIPAADVYF